MKKMRNAERRQIPNGAKFRTARNPERREIPDSAESRTATKGGMPFPRSPLLAVPHLVAVWDFAPSGIWRRYCSAPFTLFVA